MLKKWCTDVKKEESKCEDEDINYMYLCHGARNFSRNANTEIGERRKCCNCDCTTNK